MAALLLTLLVAACSADQSQSKGSRGAVPVRANVVKQESVQQTLAIIGHVEPSATVNVSARVSGQITECFVHPGQYVKAGDRLFQLDQRSFIAQVNQAQAVLKREETRLKQAQQDLGRNRTLVKNDFLSRQEYDQSQTDVATQQATIAQNKAALEIAELELSYTVINAPITGRIGQILIDPGNVIKANEATLLVINTISPAELSFSVPERFLPELNRRFRNSKIAVKALPEGDKGEPVTGYLTLIDNSVDRTTGTVTLRATFENTDERLWPGQFVRVSIIMEALDKAVVIPFQAVLEGISGQYVYLIDAENRVKETPVKTIMLEDGRLLVTQGLKGGENVVIDGQLNLVPGARVQILKAEAAKGELMQQENVAATDNNAARS